MMHRSVEEETTSANYFDCYGMDSWVDVCYVNGVLTTEAPMELFTQRLNTFGAHDINSFTHLVHPSEGALRGVIEVFQLTYEERKYSQSYRPFSRTSSIKSFFAMVAGYPSLAHTAYALIYSDNLE